jgi:hypothetical protein
MFAPFLWSPLVWHPTAISHIGPRQAVVILPTSHCGCPSDPRQHAHPQQYSQITTHVERQPGRGQAQERQSRAIPKEQEEAHGQGTARGIPQAGAQHEGERGGTRADEGEGHRSSSWQSTGTLRHETGGGATCSSWQATGTHQSRTGEQGDTRDETTDQRQTR